MRADLPNAETHPENRATERGQRPQMKASELKNSREREREKQREEDDSCEHKIKGNMHT